MHETPTKAICNKGFVAIQAFYPDQTLVSVDRIVARNPLLPIASTVSVHAKKEKAENHLIELNQLNK